MIGSCSLIIFAKFSPAPEFVAASVGANSRDFIFPSLADILASHGKFSKQDLMGLQSTYNIKDNNILILYIQANLPWGFKLAWLRCEGI